MRGSPLLRALLAFLAILALAYPLSRVTGKVATPAAPAPTAPPVPVRELHLQLSFTTPPTSFSVKHLGREVWKADAPGAELEKTLALPFPKEGIELLVSGSFPPGTALVAVRVGLTPPDGESQQKSLWGTGEISDVVTFP